MTNISVREVSAK